MNNTTMIMLPTGKAAQRGDIVHDVAEDYLRFAHNHSNQHHDWLPTQQLYLLAPEGLTELKIGHYYYCPESNKIRLYPAIGCDSSKLRRVVATTDKLLTMLCTAISPIEAEQKKEWINGYNNS